MTCMVSCCHALEEGEIKNDRMMTIMYRTGRRMCVVLYIWVVPLVVLGPARLENAPEPAKEEKMDQKKIRREQGGQRRSRRVCVCVTKKTGVEESVCRVVSP
eukprot:scaffold9243_cov162-Amphora_coffeaeformis.AAC.8